MKNLIIALVLLSSVSVISCSKESLSTPKTASIQSSSPIDYTTADISISGFQAAGTSSEISVGFTTTFQKNIKTLEILRGTTPNNLCSIYKTDGNTSSNTSLKYSTDDTETAATIYYMVKYTLTNNDWGYTPVFTLANASND